MNESFRAYIRKSRVKNGLRLTKFAAYFGIDSRALNIIENCKKKLDEKVLSKISGKFNLDFSALKNEFISEQIAYKICRSNCANEILKLAKEKSIILNEEMLNELT